jgi:biofilm PGA synthesis N-glycosyltransferase PgaC
MMEMKNFQSSNIFRILLLIMITVIMLIFFVLEAPAQWNPGGFRELLIQIMSLYLIGLFTRTLFYLGFSFMDFIYRVQLGLPEKYPLVTILIPAYNEGPVIENAIQSACTINYPNLEVLVLDDGSTDNTYEQAQIACSKYNNARALTKPNGGKADALNWGLREACGEYVLCVDADSILDPQVLMVSVPYLEKYPDVAAVAGSVLIGNAQKNPITAFQQLEYIIGLNFYKTAQSYLGIVTIVPGPVGLFRKSVLQEIGGYKTDTFAEDCDLTIRLLMKNYQIKYRPEMIAHTEAPDALSSLFTQRYRWNRGVIQAIVKNIFYLTSKKSHFRNRIILLQLVGDSIIIPIANYVFSMATIFYILHIRNEGYSFFGPFFAGLVMLDILLTVFSALTHKDLLRLSFLTFINRLTYGLALEIVRFFAMLDELLQVPMKWGALRRKGMN